jgi:phage replication O-like protein O
MAKLEKGYTKIDDDILENMARTKLNGTQFRIILLVWRCTYGWQKKEHEMSLGYLSKAAGIHKQQVKKEIDKLIKEGILIVTQESTYTKPRTIGFNKKYIQSTNTTTVSKSTDPTVSKLTDPTVSELAYQNKDINKQYKYNAVFDYYLTLDLVKHRTYTNAMRTAMKKAEKELSIDTDQMKRMLKRHQEKVVSSAKTKYPVKVRSLPVFFGQKKVDSSNLICSDYLDDVWTEIEKKSNLPKKKLELEMTN